MSDAQPIETVHDLLTWTKNPFQRCHLPKQKRQQRKQQVIHCHDYKNGYQEDKRPQGGTKECYHFQYLAYIDIFIYFSHHRITVPPLNWIQTLHRNGVQCLGTIITEWLPGIPETLELIYGPAFDHDLPSTQRDFSPVYADILVDIALYYGFDGWFINIECPLPNAIDVIILTRFLKYFEQQIKARIPEGQLMWYDSVIDTDQMIAGELKWRDHLCKSNKMMFDVCDSIFINYTWKEGFPFASKIEAQDRNYDVFTGIDVWGRNSFGGGGFNCPIALEEIQEHTSIAIFAPAWTYEYLGPKQFERHDAKLWVDASLQVEWPEPFEETPSTFPRTDKAIADYVAPRQLATTEFHTHFCRGYGKDFYWFGQKHETGQWMHLSRQSLCPLKQQYRFDNCTIQLEITRSWLSSTSLVYRGFGRAHAKLYAIDLPLTDQTVEIVHYGDSGFKIILDAEEPIEIECIQSQDWHKTIWKPSNRNRITGISLLVDIPSDAMCVVGSISILDQQPVLSKGVLRWDNDIADWNREMDEPLQGFVFVDDRFVGSSCSGLFEISQAPNVVLVNERMQPVKHLLISSGDE